MVRKSAFTLIELLVVIAIVAILAAILFPVFAQAKAAAKQTVCLSNTKQIALAYQMYAADYDDRQFFRGNWVNSRSGDTKLIGPGDSQNHYRWWNLLVPYLHSTDVFYCPADDQPTESPDAAGKADIKRSFIALSTSESLVLTQIDDVSDTMTITEKWGADHLGAVTDSWIEPFNGDFTNDFTDPTRLWTAANRHFGALNAVFMDAHAKNVRGGAIQASKDLSGCRLVYEYPFGGPNPPTVDSASTAPNQPNLCSSFTWP